MFRRWLWITLMGTMMAALTLAGCGGGGGGDDVGGMTGTLQIALTDQGGYDSVVVAIREVRAVPAGETGETDGQVPLVAAFDPPLVVDIMELSYEQLLLGQATVPAGGYDQVRLVLAPNVNGQDPVNYVTLAGDDTLHPLVTPSATQSGLKINGPFMVAGETTSTVVLDFDPGRAIVQQGNGRYLLKPTGIRVIQVEDVEPVYGALAGTVAPAAAWPTVTVEAYTDGATLAASATVNPEDGSFRLPLPAGTYTLRVSADGYVLFDTGALDPAQTFAVVDGSDTAVGVLALTAAP